MAPGGRCRLCKTSVPENGRIGARAISKGAELSSSISRRTELIIAQKLHGADDDQTTEGSGRPPFRPLVLHRPEAGASAVRSRLQALLGVSFPRKLAAMVGVFSHSAVNNDELKELQRLEEGFSRIYELLRRNDTSQFKMTDRSLALKKPISEYFKKSPQNERQLTPNEWTIINEVCSLLSDVSEDTHPIRQPNATVVPVPPEGIPTDDTQVTDLTVEARCVLEVLLDVMREKGVGSAQVAVERLAAVMDPRRKLLDSDQLENGSADLRKKAEDDLKAVIAKFDVGPSTESTAVPAPAPVVNTDPAEPAPKKKKVSRLEERRAAMSETHRRAPFLQSRDFLLLGCGFRRVRVHHRSWRWHRRRLGGRPDVKLGDDRLQVVFGLLPEICRTVLELVAIKQLPSRVHHRGQTLHSNLSAPHLEHALCLHGQVVCC
ncbi:unnamed protein product [Ectocarpus sp. CCAP 1310/34]|nr:unnamed protein product [Ectocarpus sp. CCAP 1310/34]